MTSRQRTGSVSAHLSLVACVVLLAACVRNPVTGERQLSLISEAQEIEIGRNGARQAEQSIGLVPDEALQAYVERVGSGMAAVSQRPHLPWHFRVVDDPTPNAFALPGGFIYVTRGLLSLLTNEAEMAAVLGHEIGHVTARHSVTLLSRAQLAQLGLAVGQIAFPQVGDLGANVAGAGLQLLFLHYGRDAERQADQLGFAYADSVRYDVREMADVFRALERYGEHRQRSSLPSWLASHPGGEERIRNAEDRVAALDRPLVDRRLDREEYLTRIEGLVYGENPRNGFFRESAFFHPELRFQMVFPRGWKHQNMAQSVVSVSPQQDAVIQLTLSEVQGAAQASQRFGAQQSVRVAQSRRESIQGNPAVVSLFQAQTQQGNVEGLATWIEYGGRTYQILAYTPAGRFRTHEAELSRAIRSFGALTDPRLLEVQPSRIDIVRLDRAMTLQEFQDRYPSTIPIEELAIINQVEGGASLLPAGSLVKRVAGGRGG